MLLKPRRSIDLIERLETQLIPAVHPSSRSARSSGSAVVGGPRRLHLQGIRHRDAFNGLVTRQFLDHLVSNIQSITDNDSLMQNHVQMLGFGNLDNCFIGLLQKG